jgi:hypothetical protein
MSTALAEDELLAEAGRRCFRKIRNSGSTNSTAAPAIAMAASLVAPARRTIADARVAGGAEPSRAVS